MLFVISILLLESSPEKTEVSTKTEKVSETINLEDMTSEEILNEYLALQSYENLQQRINNYEKMIKFTDGFLKELSQLSLDFLKKLKDSCDKANHYCKGIEVIGKKSLNCESCYGGKNQYEVKSVNIINESNEEIIFEVSFIENNQENSTNYKLKKIDNIWKIIDADTGRGWVSQTINLDEIEAIYRNLSIEAEKVVIQLKEIYDDAREQQQIINGISNAILSVIDEERIISVNLERSENDPNKYVFSITYYFKDIWLADNYLQVMSDSSDIFKAIFPISPKIYQVQITVKEKYKDDYGYTQERYLARTMMNRDTYRRVNWDGFKSSNLDKVTSVAYYGDSFYKSLKDLQDTLESWETTPSIGGYQTIEGAPADLCSDVKNECLEYGACDTYELLKVFVDK